MRATSGRVGGVAWKLPGGGLGDGGHLVRFRSRAFACRQAGIATALWLAIVMPAQMVLAPVAYAVKPAPVDPTPSPMPVGTLYESTDQLVEYTGAWDEVADSAASGGSYSSIDGEGTALISFDGTGIQVIATTGPALGKLEVTLDGDAVELVDFYSSSVAYQQIVWSAADLTEGVHSLELAWSGEKYLKATGTTVNLDAVSVEGLLVQPVAPPQLVRYESEYGSIVYQGVWTDTLDALASGGFVRSADTTSTATVAFTGTALTILSKVGPSFGKASVSVDGGTPEVVELYSKKVANQQPVWSTSGLASQEHTVTVEWTGVRNAASTDTEINIDAFVVLGSLPQVPADSRSVMYVAGSILTDTIWTSDRIWVVQSSIEVPLGTTLTIEPGTVVKFGSGTGLSVLGTLNAAGTAEKRITFTSLSDDTTAGDTNGDGTDSVPACGDWQGLSLGSTAGASRLQYVDLQYSGVRVDCAVSLNNITAQNASTGVSLSGSAIITDSTFAWNSDGVYVSGGSATLIGCTLADNSVGLRVSSGTPRISGCRISDNSGDGVCLDGGAATLVDNTIDTNGGAPIYLAANATPTFEVAG